MRKFIKIIISLMIVMSIMLLTSCQIIIEQGKTDSSTDKAEQNASNDYNLLKNQDLKTTCQDNEYYTTVYAGNYLENDFPEERGAYFKEIHSYEEFLKCVENPNVVEESIFEENIILVVRKVGCPPTSNIGYKNYDFSKKSIDLVTYPVIESDGIEKTLTDYLIISYKDIPVIDEPQRDLGELYINVINNSYYEFECLEPLQNPCALYFENITLANEFLQYNGYQKLSVSEFEKVKILLLCINVSLDSYTSSMESCYLGFENFNTNGSDIYITLERRIVNEDYGVNKRPMAFAILIPDELVCNEIVKSPNVHVLVKDDMISAVS